MPNLSGMFRVVHIELINIRRNPKIWIIFLFIFAIAFQMLNPVVYMGRDTGYRASLWGGAMFLLNSSSISWVSALYVILVVLLYSDAPFINANQELCILRCGKKRWLYAQSLYILILAILLTLMWIICAFIVLIPQGSWAMRWDTVWKTLTVTSAKDQYGVLLFMPERLIRQYTLAEAFWLSAGLKLCFFILIGNVIFFGSLFSRAIGISMGLLFALQGLFTEIDAPYIYIWFAPASFSNLFSLSKYATSMYPTPSQAFLLLIGFIGLFTILINVVGRRRI